MSRVALLCSEPLGERVAGIGLRYVELARRLPAWGIAVDLVCPGEEAQLHALEERLGGEARVVPFERGRLADRLAGCRAAVAQGQLANDLLGECPELPIAIDLYDPWLVENLHYHSTLGLDPYRNDHATWILQLSAGDFFLCSSEEQRQYYLGFLTAVGRVNPQSMAADPDGAKLIAVAPFGVPDELPEHRPVLPPRAAGERLLLFGGLYDWYDPWTLLKALLVDDRPEWRILFIRNPFAETPQSLFRRVESWCRARGLWGTRVLGLDWVPFERRYDLLRDVDLMVSTHRLGLETRLSLRTRFLDALVAGCPVVTTEGGTVSRLLRERDAGWVVPERDPQALLAALDAALEPGERKARIRRGRELAREFRWSRVIEPVLEFCREPWRDATKEGFAVGLPTHAPPDALGFRVRRRLRRLLEGAR
ncbi:MAG TPA: glycosyltransferase family 4 protein [Thermoanaerobaculia bacterium]|nr:glycosyltransferase family 4 protein [Thermoanaerobaculia bacterium]